MPKYHVRCDVQIMKSVDHIIDANEKVEAHDRFENIMKILLDGDDTFFDLFNVQIDEIKYVNDKGKE